jgi:hypothetical protein
VARLTALSAARQGVPDTNPLHRRLPPWRPGGRKSLTGTNGEGYMWMRRVAYALICMLPTDRRSRFFGIANHPDAGRFVDHSRQCGGPYVAIPAVAPRFRQRRSGRFRRSPSTRSATTATPTPTQPSTRITTPSGAGPWQLQRTSHRDTQHDLTRHRFGSGGRDGPGGGDGLGDQRRRAAGRTSVAPPVVGSRR